MLFGSWIQNSSPVMIPISRLPTMYTQTNRILPKFTSVENQGCDKLDSQTIPAAQARDQSDRPW